MSALRRRLAGSHLLQGSAWILIGLGLQAGLGFVFWTLGAQVATSDEVGRATAVYTSLQFVNFVSGLGLTVALARHATERSREADGLLGWAMGAAALASTLASTIFLAVTTGDGVTRLVHTPLQQVLFVFYAVGIAIGLLVDVRLMAGRHWGWLIGRLAVVGVLRLPLTQVDVGLDPDEWLYHLMVAPIALAGVGSVLLLGPMGAGRVRWHRPATLRMVAHDAGVNWGATLASQTPQFLLPLLVAHEVASSVNASFFLAWTVTGLVLLAPAAVGQVLLVEGAKGLAAEADLARGVRDREALAFSLGLCGVALVGALAVGPIVSAAFGDDYDELIRLLPLLVASGLPWSVTSVRLSQARIRRDHVSTVAITTTLAVAVLVPALTMIPSRGTEAAWQSWLFGNLVAAAVASVLHARRGRPGPVVDPGQGTGQDVSASVA